MLKKKNLFILIIGYLFIGSSALAFSISPLKYSAVMSPNSSKDWEVKITNNSNQASNFTSKVFGLKQDQQGRSVLEKNIDIAENWFKFPLNNITILPGETKTAIFNVEVPPNTPPGDHYLGLTIEEQGEGALLAQLATALKLQIAGEAREKLVIENFSLNRKIFFDKKWLAQLQLRNAGNVELNLAGQKNIFYFGKNIFEERLNLGNNLFSQANRLAQLDLYPQEKMMWPGKYRADLKIKFGVTNQIVSTRIDFWYWPYWFMVILAGLLVLPFLFFRKKNHAVS
jgi:hypothetical protein